MRRVAWLAKSLYVSFVQWSPLYLTNGVYLGRKWLWLSECFFYYFCGALISTAWFLPSLYHQATPRDTISVRVQAGDKNTSIIGSWKLKLNIKNCYVVIGNWLLKEIKEGPKCSRSSRLKKSTTTSRLKENGNKETKDLEEHLHTHEHEIQTCLKRYIQPDCNDKSCQMTWVKWRYNCLGV